MSAHKWAEVIKAWADGKTIQYRIVPSEEWVDLRCTTAGPWFNTEWEWRIKPDRWYRVVLWDDGSTDSVDSTHTREGEEWAESHELFVRWLTDRVYY